MKKKLIIFACLLALGAGAFAYKPSEVNEKVLKSFKEAFPNAAAVNWQEFSDKYTADFTESDIRCVISYDKDGNFMGSTRYYPSKYLPVNILCKLSRKYPGKKVFGVTEISTEESVAYYIKLEDATNWTTIKAGPAGDMEEVEKYKKAANE